MCLFKMKDSTFEVICEEPNNGKNTISSIDMVVLKNKRKTLISLTFNEPNEENMVMSRENYLELLNTNKHMK